MTVKGSKAAQKLRYEKPMITDLGGTGSWLASTGQYPSRCRPGLFVDLGLCLPGLIGE